ncbi:DUF4402 domain-containing protein [Geothrix paludis]|uniref:DUF4402 domain-containing protein n=1 Tax=Geothrix paludis TaxID=2922722 RepID=UPI001FAE4483|nr:DUF4402 domain-containing protein [Geothrix paludis]
MHTFSRILAGALLLAAPAAFALDNATATATARIYVPITLNKNTDLSFGDIFADPTGGTVTLDPKSTTRTTGGPALATTGTVSPAAFTVGGKRNASYAITLPADGTVTLSGPGAAMLVSKFTASVNNGTPTATPTGLIPNTAGATQTFTVGATLTLGANQMDGDYTGTFNVTVAYN